MIDYSLILSLLALLVSAFVAGWTVYRDAIQKPRFRVGVAVKTIHQHGQPPIGPNLYVDALNLGPLPNRIGPVFARPSWFDRKFRKKLKAFIMHDASHPGTSAKDQMVEVGDSVSFAFPINEQMFQHQQFAQIGVADGYGRMHWAPKKMVAKAYAEAKKRLAAGRGQEGA